MKNQLRLGILGMSAGNGHPYSWSAIFNGYNRDIMGECPFPAIPDYLSRQLFPGDAIGGAAVTHIWTQDIAISEHIAAASRIPHIVHDQREMIGQVDAVLLARDDAENHYELAAPMLDAGLPLFIDKPLALTVQEAERLYSRERWPGQIFTCSAMRYAREFHLSAEDLLKLGQLRYVDACAPKAWDTYAVHAIEPLMMLVGNRIERMRASGHGDVRHLDLRWKCGLGGRISTLGAASCGVVLRLFGDSGKRVMVFEDAFSAFKASLEAFIEIVTKRAKPQEKDEVLTIVRVIEAGRAACESQ